MQTSCTVIKSLRMARTLTKDIGGEGLWTERMKGEMVFV